MKKCSYQSLAVKFLIILNITLGNLFSNSVSAQESAEMLTLPFKQCWSFQTKVNDNNIASDNEDGILVPTSDGKLFALDLKSGEKLWETELGGEVVSELVDDESKKNIYVATKSFSTQKENDGKKPDSFSSNQNNTVSIKLRALDKTTGITNWQTSLSTGTSDKQKIFIFVYEHKIIVADQNGNITALSEINGETLWTFPQSLELNNIYFDSQNKYFVILSKNGIVVTMTESGKIVFRKETNSTLTAAYLFSESDLILGNKKGEIFAIDIKTKKHLWKSRAGAEISNLSFTPKGILATSLDNFIYLIAPESGKVIWKRRLEGRLVIEPYLFDNSVIVMTLGSPKATILDLSEGKPVNQIFLHTDNYFINRPIFKSNLIVFPTADGIFTYTNPDGKCTAE